MSVKEFYEYMKKYGCEDLEINIRIWDENGKEKIVPFREDHIFVYNEDLTLYP